MSTYSEAITIASGIIADVEEFITEHFVDPTLQQLLDALARGEEDAQAALHALVMLRARGIDQPSDYVQYNKLRNDLLGAQMKVYAVCRHILTPISDEAVRRLPYPHPLPVLTYDREASLRAARGGVRGLGEPIEITAGAGIALAIAAVIIAIGIAYILAQVVIAVSQEVAGVFVAQARAQQFRDLCNARLEVYNNCREGGGDPTTCAEAAGVTIPTPEESGTTIPEAGALDPTPWVLLGVGGTLLVVVGGALFWFYRKAKRSVGVGRVPVRQVAALPSVQRAPDLDGSKSSYNLEISAGLGGRKRKRSLKGYRAPGFKRPPKVGTRVVFDPNPASLALYREHPSVGESGTVRPVSTGRGKSHFMRGPGGGLVYVDWDESRFQGVSLHDLSKET